MKKTIIVTCCIIIASLGIALTGCGKGNSDKKAESHTEKYVENTTESSTEEYVESSTEESTESNVDKYSDSPYVGTWVATVAEYEGVEYDAEEVIQASKFIFHVDGTGIFIGDDGGDGLTLDIEWEPTEDGLKFTDYGGEGYFTYKDGKLLMDVELESGGSTTAYFEKQK